MKGNRMKITLGFNENGQWLATIVSQSMYHSSPERTETEEQGMGEVLTMDQFLDRVTETALPHAAWPGMYTGYVADMATGDDLCIDCARKELKGALEDDYHTNDDRRRENRWTGTLDYPFLWVFDEGDAGLEASVFCANCYKEIVPFTGDERDQLASDLEERTL